LRIIITIMGSSTISGTIGAGAIGIAMPHMVSRPSPPLPPQLWACQDRFQQPWKIAGGMLQPGAIRDLFHTARPFACCSAPAHRMVNIVPLWNYIDIHRKIVHTAAMRSRMDELTILAEENDGLFTSQEARDAGVLDSVLVRLAQRRRLERVARGVYRIRNFPTTRFSQYREAIFWLRASSGPENVALSHETALSVYGISDANPSKIHVTAPARARLRRKRPTHIVVHRANLPPGDVTTHEGMPITTIERTIGDILTETAKVDLALRAIADARREGYITADKAKGLRRLVDRDARDLEQKHPRERLLRR
jgi:predicted transcriptional regulator of viral defense system